MSRASSPASSTASSPAVDPRPRRLLIVALGALSAFGPLCLDMYLPALPQLPERLSGTATQAQLSLTACIVGLALGQLFAGPASDRWGRRRPLLVGVLLFTVASLACVWVTDLPQLIVLRAVQGGAGAAGIVIGRAVVADLYRGRAAAALYAAIAMINGLAPILAPLIGGQILRVSDFRGVFVVLAVIGAALIVLAWAAIPESLPREARSGHGLRAVGRSYAVVVTDVTALAYLGAGTAVAAAMFGYISASPFLLQDGFGLSPQQFSACFAANALGIVAASQVGRLALHRGVGAQRLLTWAVGQATVGVLVLGVGLLGRTGLWTVLAGLWVMVSAVGLALPNASALVMDRHRTIAGYASAVFGLVQFATATLTTPLVGIGDRSRGTALAVTAAVCVLVAILSLAVALLVRRREPDHPVARG